MLTDNPTTPKPFDPEGDLPRLTTALYQANPIGFQKGGAAVSRYRMYARWVSEAILAQDTSLAEALKRVFGRHVSAEKLEEVAALFSKLQRVDAGEA